MYKKSPRDKRRNWFEGFRRRWQAVFQAGSHVAFLVLPSSEVALKRGNQPWKHVGSRTAKYWCRCLCKKGEGEKQEINWLFEDLGRRFTSDLFIWIIPYYKRSQGTAAFPQILSTFTYDTIISSEIQSYPFAIIKNWCKQRESCCKHFENPQLAVYLPDNNFGRTKHAF